MTIIAAADGSALGNPGPAGWAWYVDDSCWRAGGWPHGTNNQGELMAVLDLFRSTAHVPQEELLILCDSQYVINCITKWMPGWKRKGWRKADGKPVLNVDLLKDIDQAIVGRKYTFEWVKGHAGHDLNEAADERARAVATAYQQGVAHRAGPGYPGAREDDKEVRLAHSSTPVPAGAGASSLTAGSATLKADRSPRPHFEPTLFGESGIFGQADLFSELDDDASAQQLSAEDTVLALERELLRPDVRADIGRIGVLLHPDFAEIGSSGRFWTRDAMMVALEEDPGEPTELELLSADRLSENTILLNYRSFAPKGSALRSSIWMLDRGQWRLRFHQGTVEG
ncbi:ribonuclease HI family protein [Paenarthrobacter aurescens]|nr:ribonuclease HI family protein [Paenarthrobacter aurescens]MDO6142584.1 ribonuclease HI family protein [Paenarthrobacter aurescens]MDO6146431.1 ribonuclease HI family protein [Paenarthrobacter aurescens]MDO6157676.1 ribonuclease HI family protein [Paenarthrobacter aurescens]MDO6161661.1 ribonuclease HI family protein [Paenarthrobacter aurescens]